MSRAVGFMALVCLRRNAMWSRLVSWLRVLPISILLYGCESPSDPPIVQPPLFLSGGVLPLKVGYLWQYDQYALTDSGTTAGKIGSLGFKIQAQSLAPPILNADTILHWVYFDPQTGWTGYVEWFYRNYADGLYILGGRAPTDSIYTKLLYLKYPVQKGEVWQRPHLIFHTVAQTFSIPDSQIYSCLDTNALFETPLGTYQCIVYQHMEPIEEIPGKHYDILEYYAPGLGKLGEIRYIYSEATHDRYPIQKNVLVTTTVPMKR